MLVTELVTAAADSNPNPSPDPNPNPSPSRDQVTGGELFDRIVSRGSYTERDAAEVLG